MPSVAEEYGRGMCEECVRGEVHSVATNAPVAQECMTNVKGMWEECVMHVWRMCEGRYTLWALMPPVAQECVRNVRRMCEECERNVWRMCEGRYTMWPLMHPVVKEYASNVRGMC